MSSTPRPRAGFRWATGIAESLTPIFVLDRKRRLALFNRGCAEWTGWKAEELLGQICDYVTEADLNSLAAVLSVCAPPPEVWQGNLAEVPCFIPHRTGPARAGRLRFQPLLDAEEEVASVWGELLAAQESQPLAPPTPAQLLHAELAALRHEVRSRYGKDSVIAHSPPMQRVLAQLSAAQNSFHSVLFVGEPGTGREHLARVLHNQGSASRQAFVPVDCRRTSSAELKRLIKQLPDDRHELEAFRTGALFFRDISAMQRDVQERLTDWLTKKAESQAPRVTAADAQSLHELVEQDQFLPELYYQLTTQVIDVPALRQRPDEILLLAQYFLEERNRKADRQLGGFSPAAAEALREYHWPGQVAEVRSVVQAAADQAVGPLVQPDDLPLWFRAGQDAQRLGPAPVSEIQTLDTVLEQVEREHIQQALAASRQNLSKAAELLGMSRPKLYRRLEALGLAPSESPPE